MCEIGLKIFSEDLENVGPFIFIDGLDNFSGPQFFNGPPIYNEEKELPVSDLMCPVYCTEPEDVSILNFDANCDDYGAILLGLIWCSMGPTSRMMMVLTHKINVIFL